MTLAQIAGAVLAIAVVAIAAGFVPQRLVSAINPGPDWRWAGSGLSAWAAAVGLAVLAGTGPFFPWSTAIALALLATILTAMAAVDLACFVIPDLYVGAIVVLALVGPLAPPLAEAALGAGLAGGLLWIVRFAHGRLRGREGLGLGDVKLLAALGALLGPRAILWVIVGGAAAGIIFLLLRRRDAEAITPFGTALAAPALAAAIIVRWPA